MLYSTLVEVVVEVEVGLGNIYDSSRECYQIGIMQKIRCGRLLLVELVL